MTISQSEEITEQMNTLITEIYAAFSQYSIEEIQGVCSDCCMNEENVRAIKKLPLKSLTNNTINDYLDAAPNDPESLVLEIKYLLPRIFELFNAGEEITMCAENNFNKFYLGMTELWQPQEIELIERFVRLHFQKLTAEHNDEHMTVVEVLIMWNLAGLKVDFLFEVWEAHANHSKAIVDYVHLLYSLKNNQYQKAFASKILAKAIVIWATSTRVIRHFQDSIYANLDDLNTLSEAELFDYDYLLNYA